MNLLPQFDDAPNTISSGGTCGCELHHPNLLLSLNLNLPLVLLHKLLFDCKSNFLYNFFRSVSYTDCSISSSRWENIANQGEQRQYNLKIPFPKIMLGMEQAEAKFLDRYLLKHPTKIFVIETSIELSGIPGGVSHIKVRYCLTSKDSMSCLLVTGEAHPPDGSWFKESIRQSLVDHFTEMYSELGRALKMQEKTRARADRASLTRHISWWRKGTPTHRRTSSTAMQVYFDKKAFFKSLFWLVPVLVIICAWIYVRYKSLEQPEAKEVSFRLSRISSIDSEFRSFLQKEHLVTSSLGASVNKAVDGLSEKVSRLQEVLGGADKEA